MHQVCHSQVSTNLSCFVSYVNNLWMCLWLTQRNRQQVLSIRKADVMTILYKLSTPLLPWSEDCQCQALLPSPEANVGIQETHLTLMSFLSWPCNLFILVQIVMAVKLWVDWITSLRAQGRLCICRLSLWGMRQINPFPSLTDVRPLFLFPIFEAALSSDGFYRIHHSFIQ